MSLILDALNRSRDDVDPVPNLATHHPVEPMQSPLRQYLPWICLGLALVVIAWLVLSRFGSAPTAEEELGAPVAELTQNIGSAATSVTNELKARAEARRESDMTSPVPAPKAKPAPKPVASPAAKPAPVAETTSVEKNQPPVAGNAGATPGKPALETAPAGLVEQQPAKPDPVAVTPAGANTPAKPRPDPAVAQLYRDKDLPAPVPVAEKKPARPAPAPVEKASEQEEVIDIEEVLQRAQAEMENSALEEHPAPFLSSLSQRVKDSIPTIYYQKHDYSSNSRQSTVVLNGKTVRVGGSPAAGVKVDEILSDSVVLTFRGTQFRLRALNSWVNL